jgi:hypothetical protein
MARIDILGAAQAAYMTAWQERAYLLRLAAVPFLLKLFCYVLADRFTGESNYLRFTLIMLPAYLVEGWMLAHLARLVAFGHRWPFRPTGNMEEDMAVLAERARGILSGMVVYVLINMGVGLMVAVASQYFLQFMPDGAASPADMHIPPQAALLSLAFLAFLFWGFRLLWLYIPFALNMPPLHYLNGLRGLPSSLQLIGLWLACFVPVLLVLRFAAGLFGGLAGAAGGADAGSFVMVLLTILADSLKSILSTLGITAALMQVFKADRKA